MAKQEEIREGIPNCDCGLTGGCEKCQPMNSAGVTIITESIDDLIQDALIDAGLFYLGNRDGYKDTMAELKKITKQLKQGLHSQGVVIRAERDLPPISVISGDGWSLKQCRWTQQDMLKAGYVAVEPLIEEVKE